MISRNFKELLPSYLDGENIRNHAEILMKQDKQIDEKIEKVHDWNNLQRPILIEKIQSEDAVATVKIHIHTPSPIRSVTGTRDFASINEEYSEEELVTEAVFEVTVTSISPMVLVEGTVSVETYDGTIYEKGYPENDTRYGNIYDHDESLDIIGRLLNIPRRIYKQVSYEPSYYKNTCPSYFVKLIDLNLFYWTEDDYYYFARLKKFCDGVNRKDFVVHMAEVLYNWDDASITHCKNRNTFIYPEYSSIVGDATEFDILVTPNKKYTNIDYTNMQEVISNYRPVTRLLFLLTKKYVSYVIQGMDVLTVDFSQEMLRFIAYAKYEDYDGEIYDIDYAQYRITYYNAKMESKTSNLVTANAQNRCNSTKVFSMGDYPFVKIYLRTIYEIKANSVLDERMYYLPTMRQLLWADINSVFIESASEGNMNLNRWTGNIATGGTTRYLSDEGNLNLGRNNNNHAGAYPSSDWIETLHFDITHDSSVSTQSNSILLINYLNAVDGTLRIRINSDYSTEFIQPDGTSTTLSDDFVDDDHPENVLSIERRGNKIIFAYQGVNGGRIQEEYTYTNLSVNGNLYIRTYADWNVELSSDSRYDVVGGGAISMIDLPTYDNEKWNSYTPTEAEGQTTSETTWTDEGIIELGTRQRVVYKEPLDLKNKVYTIYCYTTSVWQRIGLIKDNNTYTGANAPYKTLYYYGNTTINPEIQKYKVYVENGAIYHEWNNTKQILYNPYAETTNYYLYFYTPTPNGADKILAITEEPKEE